MIKVKAKEMLYYDNRRKREGEIFFIQDEKEFSKRSMVKVVEKPATVMAEVEEEVEEPSIDEDVI